MSANLTANQTMDLIREAMEAQFSIERSKLSVENAKTALEVARTAVELARAEEATAKNGLDYVLVKGESLGLSRRVVKSLSEELSSSILSSGLIKVEETETNAVLEAEQPIKRRATRTRRTEGEVETIEPAEVIEAPATTATSVEVEIPVETPVESQVTIVETLTEVEVEVLVPQTVTVEPTLVEPVVEVKAEPVVEEPAEVSAPVAVEAPEAPKVEMPRRAPMFLRNLNNGGVKS